MRDEPITDGRLHLRYWPDPVLTRICAPVHDFDPMSKRLSLLVAQLTEHLKRWQARGIAAPQLGVPERVFLARLTDGQILVVVNPDEIVHVDGTRVASEEGCLSLPGVYGQVARWNSIQLTFQGLTPDLSIMMFHGADAVTVQHEYDHLNGVMFFDRMTRQMRRAVLREYEKRRRGPNYEGAPAL